MQAFQDENDSLKGKLAKSGATEVEALRAALAQVEGAKARAEARAESAAADAKEAARKLRVAENGLGPTLLRTVAGQLALRGKRRFARCRSFEPRRTRRRSIQERLAQGAQKRA